jgi:hypothetical protein
MCFVQLKSSHASQERDPSVTYTRMKLSHLDSKLKPAREIDIQHSGSGPLSRATIDVIDAGRLEHPLHRNRFKLEWRKGTSSGVMIWGIEFGESILP